jgi:hypothetical protein
MKRRQMTQFLALLTGGVAASSFASVPAVGRSLKNAMTPAYLTREFFEAQLGREFNLEGSGVRKLRLKAVESACCHHSREQFHAVFETGPGSPLDEGIYILERNGRSRMELFMTVSEAGASPQRLVATINLQAAV